MTDSQPARAAAFVSRRTVTKAAAWSLPVIAAASAMPLAAASVSSAANFTVATEPVNVPAGGSFGDMVIRVADDQGNPISGGTFTPHVSGAGSMLPGTAYPIENGLVTIPAGTFQRTAGDASTDDIVVTGTYTPATGGAEPVSLTTLRNREVVKLFHDQDALAGTGVDWTLERRPTLRATVFTDFFIRPRIEAGPRYARANPTSILPAQSFDPPLEIKVTATNASWGWNSAEKQNNGLIDKHNGEHRLALLYQDSTDGSVIVEGYADYSTGVGSEKRRAHIRMTWPTAGERSTQIQQWETLLP